MQTHKILSIFLLTSLCAACGSGGSDTRQSFNLTLQYFYQPTWARFSFYQTTPVSSDTPNDKIYSIGSGSLPPGESLSRDTGNISGVPTTPGTYTAEIRLVVKDYDGAAAVTLTQTIADLSLKSLDEKWIAGASFMLKPAVLEEGIRVVDTDSTNGVVVTYQLVPGSKLPDGLSLDAKSGLSSGIGSVKAASYPNIQYQAIVTYQGLPHIYTSTPVTYIVNAV